MGLLRLINAARLAPLEELLAEVRGGTTASNTGAASSRATTATAVSIPALPRREPLTPPAPVAVVPKIPARDPIASVPARAQDHQPTAQLGAAAPLAKPLRAQISGISEEQVAEIKHAIQAQQKFLGELIEQATRWELAGAELRLYFPADKRSFAEMLEGREPIEKLRIASGKALGRAVRVCAKLEAVAAAAASASRGGPATQELRAQFERDPMVKSMLQRFGGKIAEVKHRPEET
jgi:hypothetical protein